MTGNQNSKPDDAEPRQKPQETNAQAGQEQESRLSYNEIFGAAGAKIIAHKRTLEWMSTDHWVTAEDRYEKARPKAALKGGETRRDRQQTRTQNRASPQHRHDWLPLSTIAGAC